MGNKAANQARFRERLAELRAREDPITRRFLDLQGTSKAALQAHLQNSNPQARLKKLVKEAEELLELLKQKEDQKKDIPPADGSLSE